MNSTLDRRKLYLITTILKNSLDALRLLCTIATDVKRISFFQIVFERVCHQIKILMKDRLGGSTESDTGIRCTGRLVTKLQPAKIKRTYRKFTAVYQFSLQSNPPILFGFLNSYCLRSQRLIMHHLYPFTQPKEITHRQSRLFRDKIKERSSHISRHCQVRYNRHSVFLLTG